MKKVSFSDMVTKATRSAEIEMMRSNERASIARVRKRLFGLADSFKAITGEDIETGDPVKSDQEVIYDIMDNSESEKI